MSASNKPKPSEMKETAPNIEVDSSGEPVVIRDFNKINWKEFACGWGAAYINITVSFPINKVIFRQMLYGVKVYSAFNQLQDEGLYFLYRGMLPPLCQKTLSMSIMFGVYEEVSRTLIESGHNPYVAKATGGMTAGTIEAILMPFERIQTLLVNSTYHGYFKNTLQAFKRVGMHYGVGEYYRGVTPVLLRNGPSNVGFFLMREEVQRLLPEFDSRIYQSVTEFIYGALIGALLSSVFYPLNVVKVAMQSKLGGDYENTWRVLVQIYRDRGSKVTNIYYGVSTNCMRAFISWGVMNCAYEYLKKIL